MATRARSLRSAHHGNGHPKGQDLSTKARLAAVAGSPAARAAFVVVGTMGLAALAVAIFGPKRFEREILAPVRRTVGDQAHQLWADATPVRNQIASLFARAQNASGREKLAQNFQSWIGHFKAG